VSIICGTGGILAKPTNDNGKVANGLQDDSLLKGRADLVLSSHVGTMGVGHYRATSRPWKRYRRLSSKHDTRYVSPLNSGIGQPQQ
jgi:hypothetical protein